LDIAIVVPSDIGCHAQQLFGTHAFRKDIHFFFPGGVADMSSGHL